MNEGTYIIPGAIILAGVLVAGTLFLTAERPERTDRTTHGDQAAERQTSVEEMRPVSADDHIRGSAQAAVKVVEYSDMECPFCARFHVTMQQIMNEYDNEQVAWVYRHFPLTQLHPRAVPAALAAECAAELGGNDAFWQYVDLYFAEAPGGNQTDPSLLPQFATAIGLERNAFSECVASERHMERVQRDAENAVATGGTGTPHNIVVGPNDERIVVFGAQPISEMRRVIDQLLQVQ